MSEDTNEEVFEETTEQTPTAENNGGAAVEAVSPYKGFFAKLDKFFGISKSGSSFKTEIIAGITTFMSMVYALLVVPGMFPDTQTMFGAYYIATALGAITGTMLMALFARMPLAQASGLGATAYVSGTLMGDALNLTYANSMIFVLIDGVIFILLTATGLRKKILAAIPNEVKKAISVGIGLFIAFIGFQNAGVVTVSNNGTAFASFNVLSNGISYFTAMTALVAIIGVLAIAVMSKKKINGAMLWGILGSTVLYYIFMGLGCAWKDEACLAMFKGITIDNPFAAFKLWGQKSVGQVFAHGFDFSGYLSVEGNNAGTLVVLILTSALSLCMLDMFDTLGTLYGACSKGGLLDENGNPIKLDRCMLTDAIATCAGSLFGSPTVTTYVEASSGVAAGGRTGFTALITGLCFFVAMFLSPIARLIPSAATSAALIWVGVLMMSSVVEIDWQDPAAAIVAFLTITVMAFGYSISKGIGVGIISCIIVKLCTGKVKEISVVTWVIAVLFILMFVLTN